MKPTISKMEHAEGPFRSQHACRSHLTIPAVSTSQNLEMCLAFPALENRNRKPRSGFFFLIPLLPTIQFDVVHENLDLQHKQHTNSCRQHVLNIHVLVSPCLLDSLDSFGLWEFLLPRVPDLLRFPFRHLHEIHQMVRCLHQSGLHLDSEFSSDLPARCSAISVSRLLTILRRILLRIVRIIGLCWFLLFGSGRNWKCSSR